MREGEVGSLIEEIGNAAFQQFSPGHSDSCKVTLGIYTRSGYKQHILQRCLNLDSPLLPFRAKQQRISTLLSKAKISVTFLDSDNGVYR